MGNSALIVVIASVLSGIMILLNIQRINTESNIVQTQMEEDVLARELAHTGLGIALANIYTNDGLSSANFELNYQGGFIDVDNFVNSPETQELQFDVFSEFGDAQYLIHSRYQYEVNFPFAMYLDVPNLNLITEEESTIYGGADAQDERFYMGTSEWQRLEDQEGLSGLVDIGDVERNINSALDDAWDGLPGEITEVSILDSDETFSNQLPDIDPDQDNPWLQEFYFQTLDNMRVGGVDSQDALYEGNHLFGSETGEPQNFAFGLPASTAIVRIDGDMTVKGGSTVTGHGILLVEGNLTVEEGAALEWNGIVYLRPETTNATAQLNGAVNINGALVAYQEALPEGSHMDVTTNRDLTARWLSARGIYDSGPKPIPGPWFVHRHKWDVEWNGRPPVSSDREVIFRTADGSPTHEANHRFNETLNAIKALGINRVQLEFVNPGQSGMGIYSIKFADSPPGDLPTTRTVAGGFNGSLKSNAFAPDDLVHFSIFFRSLRMLRLMRDPEGTPFAFDGPHRVTDNHNREGVFHVSIKNADTDELLYTSSIYQHVREIENDEFEEALDDLKEDIEAGNFGLTIDMGPGASIRYDNVAASNALGRTNFSAFALLGTWSQRCNATDVNCDLTLNPQ